MNPHERLLDVASALGLELPPGAPDRLLRYAALLRDRGRRIGVISARDSDRVLERHVLDSLRAGSAVGPDDVAAYDLGAGAGLPGLVVAIAVPHLSVGLVEIRRRRVAFLELALDELGVPNASVIHGRIEDLVEPVDLCFSRALAPLPQSWDLARPLLRPGGRLVYFAGSRRETVELPEAGEVRLLETPVLESSGPLVIMTR
ncbi:MAG TPA: 16S rRNA (guanine(527)-N(7))-methyltransferase RsmG [Actinomycetota bacterium]